MIRSDLLLQKRKKKLLHRSLVTRLVAARGLDDTLAGVTFGADTSEGVGILALLYRVSIGGRDY